MNPRRALVVGLWTCTLACDRAEPPVAPTPPRLSQRASDEVAEFERTYGGPRYFQCTECHVAPQELQPGVADVASVELHEFFGGFYAGEITTAFGADGRIVRRAHSPRIPRGEVRVDTGELYLPTWEKAVARLLDSGYFRIELGALSRCHDIMSAKITLRLHDGRELVVVDPCWGVHRMGDDADHPGFGRCVALLREMAAVLDHGMPRLEPDAR